MATDVQMPPVMILCGGKGTRLRDVSELLPKPMVPIGELPIVWHIMKCYAAFGVRKFILCLGYKREVFVDFFMTYHLRTSDATIQLGHAPQVTFHGEPEEADWQVTLAGTGLDTMTGGRVARAFRYVEGDEFFLTYGDGVSDIDLHQLLAQHRAAGRAMTLSAVHPEARFGGLALQDDAVVGFEEKPPAGEGSINGGFMVLTRRFVERYLNLDESLILEQDPMRRAAADGEMTVYRHEGFWQCMDNQREYWKLNDLWNRGNAPWTKYWK